MKIIDLFYKNLSYVVILCPMDLYLLPYHFLFEMMLACCQLVHVGCKFHEFKNCSVVTSVSFDTSKSFADALSVHVIIDDESDVHNFASIFCRS